MEPSGATDLAALAGALGTALALVAAQRALVLLGFAVLAAGETALGLLLLTAEEREALLSAGAGLLLFVAAAVLGLAAALVRFPSAVPVVVLLAAPFRVPVEVGDERVFLLLPLYGVLTAAVLAVVYRAARGERLSAPPKALAVPVAAFAALAGVSMLWAEDVRRASIDLVFFFFPFAALFAVVARAPLPRSVHAALAATVVALAAVFSVVGITQLWTGDLFFARDIEVANAYTSYDRVTSVFHDPSIYGRHLALAIVVLVVLLWFARVHGPIAAALIALLWAGLFVSYSQSSMVALFVAVLAVSLLAADRRSRRVLVVGAACFALVSVGLVVTMARDDSLRRVTSGRSDLVANTAAVVASHPAVGVGIGGEERASRAEAEERGTLGKASHTTPLTVAAELGAVGIAAYLLFLFAAGRALARIRAREPVLATGLAGILLVLVVHSLFYSGFFEDPLMWESLAVAGAALAAPAAVRERLPLAPWARPSRPRPAVADERPPARA